tara:strand:- start:1353 stop:2456 length:1104 start_codon:yes stop_codon:yes gene_type:complete
MADIFNGILESDAISEDLKAQIQETWKSKLDEAREEITAELRDEFAQRYENDKGQIVEAMDKMLTDRITAEIEELKADRAALAEQTVAYKTNIDKHIGLVDKFVAEQLAKEVKELHADRTDLKSNFAKLENFVVKQLAKELTEFEADKKAVVEQKVKLVAEGKKMIAEAKQRFVSKAADVVEKTVEKSLRSELSQLKDDIKVAKENNFGRKVFEAFAGEYMSSHLAEGTEVRKLQKELETATTNTTDAESKLKEKDAEIEAVQMKLRIAEDKNVREKALTELTANLSKDKRRVMNELLESVQTSDLKKQFNKYLPAVLNESAPAESNKTIVTESVTEVTGNREAPAETSSSNGDIVELKKLAGLGVK